MGGSENSQLMCRVCCRLSGKQHQMSCFHKVVWKHCSGEVDEFQIFWCEISQDFVHQKLLKSVHFLPSYSKYKKGCFTGDTVYITTNILSLFNSLNDSFKYSKNEMNNEHRNRVTRVTKKIPANLNMLNKLIKFTQRRHKRRIKWQN